MVKPFGDPAAGRCDIRDEEPDVGDAESVAIGAVARLWCRGGRVSRRERAEHQQLSAESEEDPKLTLEVAVAQHFGRFEVLRVERRRGLGVFAIDVDVIERFDAHSVPFAPPNG